MLGQGCAWSFIFCRKSGLGVQPEDELKFKTWKNPGREFPVKIVVGLVANPLTLSVSTVQTNIVLGTCESERKGTEMETFMLDSS